MTMGLLFLALNARQPSAVDSLAVYSQILEQVRTEFPARPVALATTRSGVGCMPLCGVPLRDPGDAAADHVELSTPSETDHSRTLLDSLRTRGLIERTCATKEGWYGCPNAPEHLFVALGEITTHPRGGPEPVADGVWVKVALLVPCAVNRGRTSDGCHPEAMGYWYLLRQGEDGRWGIVRRAPGFTA